MLDNARGDDFGRRIDYAAYDASGLDVSVDLTGWINRLETPAFELATMLMEIPPRNTVP